MPSVVHLPFAPLHGAISLVVPRWAKGQGTRSFSPDEARQ
ncbi:MAG: hypothetical protein ACJAVM_001457 [Sulfitobacter sp.]|jgi:hypothetical protein